MTLRRFVVPCLIGLLLFPLHLTAQNQRSFGVNLGVLGTQQIGFTYHIVPTVTLRPALTFGWAKNSVEGASATYATRTDLGLGFDLLFPMAGSEELTPYLGVGGNASHAWFSAGSFNDGTSTRWGLNAIFGVRTSLTERLAAYGELVARYSNDGSDYHRQRITVGTTALGVIVYFD